MLDNVQIGLVPPNVLKQLEHYQDVFIIARDLITSESKFVTLSLKLTDRKSRSQKLQCVLRDWKDRELFPSLKGWRNEKVLVDFYFKLLTFNYPVNNFLL